MKLLVHLVKTIVVCCLLLGNQSFAADESERFGFIESLNVDDPEQKQNLVGLTKKIKMKVSGKIYTYKPSDVDVIVKDNNVGSIALKVGARIQFTSSVEKDEDGKKTTVIKSIIVLNPDKDDKDLLQH